MYVCSFSVNKNGLLTNNTWSCMRDGQLDPSRHRKQILERPEGRIVAAKTGIPVLWLGRYVLCFGLLMTSNWSINGTVGRACSNLDRCRNGSVGKPSQCGETYETWGFEIYGGVVRFRAQAGTRRTPSMEGRGRPAARGTTNRVLRGPGQRSVCSWRSARNTTRHHQAIHKTIDPANKIKRATKGEIDDYRPVSRTKY
jgi:hypothetical protein